MAIILYDGFRVKAESPLDLHSIVGTKDLNTFGTKPIYATKEAFASSPYSYNGAIVYDVDTNKRWLLVWEWDDNNVLQTRWEKLPIGLISGYEKYVFTINISNQNYNSTTKILTVSELNDDTFKEGDDCHIIVNGVTYYNSISLNNGTNTLKWLRTDYDLSEGDEVELILNK